MSDYFQTSEIITYQKPNCDEKDEVVKPDESPHGETVSSDATTTAAMATAVSKIVVLDYTTDGRAVPEFGASADDGSRVEKIRLAEMNVCREDVVRTVGERLRTSKTADGAYVMRAADTASLDKMIGLACVAMRESEADNRRLSARNSVLERECADYGRLALERDRLALERDRLTLDRDRLALERDRLALERDRLECQLRRTAVDLCTALGRRADDGHSVTHLINECAALAAHADDCRYVANERDRLRSAWDEQRGRVRATAAKELDGVLDAVEKLKERLIAEGGARHAAGRRRVQGSEDLIGPASDGAASARHGGVSALKRHPKKTVGKFTAGRVGEKNNDDRSSRDGNSITLEDRLSSAEAEIEHLKRDIVASDRALSEKNKIVSRLIDAEIGWKNEVFALKKDLKLKRAQIMLTERIAKLQLIGACNNIRNSI